MSVKIITNNVPRDIIDAWDLTRAEREEFDFVDWDAVEAGNDNPEFFRYKGNLHYLGDFMRWDGCENEELLKWDGYSSDTYFSGLLVRYAGDEHVVAWFYVYDAIL
jgi:hypothetical protein